MGVCRSNVMLLNKAYIKICETFPGIYKFFMVQYPLCYHDSAAGKSLFQTRRDKVHFKYQSFIFLTAELKR